MPAFPKTAAGYKSWNNAVIQQVTGAALYEDEAFQWISRVMDDDVTYDELGNAGVESPLDSKLRSGFSKHTCGESHGKTRICATSSPRKLRK